MQVVETIDQISNLNFKSSEKLAYVTQTTLSVDDTKDIIKVLKSRFPNIEGPDV